jgi:hypothetical protein
MTIEQTVDIPASHRLTIEVPRDIPAGKAIIAFTPVAAPQREGGGKIHLTRQMVAEMMGDETLCSLTGILHTDMTADEIRAERLAGYDHIS